MKREKLIFVGIFVLFFISSILSVNIVTSVDEVEGIVKSQEIAYPHAPIISDISDTRNLVVDYTYNNTKYLSNVSISGNINEGDCIQVYVNEKGDIVPTGNIFAVVFSSILLFLLTIASFCFCIKEKNNNIIPR